MSMSMGISTVTHEGAQPDGLVILRGDVDDGACRQP